MSECYYQTWEKNRAVRKNCPVLSSSRFIVVYIRPVHPDLELCSLRRALSLVPASQHHIREQASGYYPQPIALFLLSWENQAPWSCFETSVYSTALSPEASLSSVLTFPPCSTTCCLRLDISTSAFLPPTRFILPSFLSSSFSQHPQSD